MERSKANKPFDYFNVNSLFHKMDEGLQNYYSSKQNSNKNASGNVCVCVLERQQKDIEKQFYENQLSLIQHSIENLQREPEKQSLTFIKFLTFMKDYLNKVLYLLNKKILCDCKNKVLSESLMANRKMSFLREQNQKFFKLYEEKSEQCEQLRRKIKELEIQNYNVQKSSNYSISASNTAPICHINANNPSIFDLKSIKFTNDSRKSAKSSSNNLYHKLSVDIDLTEKDQSKVGYSKNPSIQSSNVSQTRPNETQRACNNSIAEVSHQRYFKQKDSNIQEVNESNASIFSNRRNKLFHNTKKKIC